MSEIVNPTTKIGLLLDAHPELEEVLISISPEFQRLRNPLLRRTVARVATVEQAARMAGLPVAVVVGRLRQALGQASPEAEPVPPAEGETPAPAWVTGADPTCILSAEEVLASGRTPVAAVCERLAAATPGGVVLLRAPFYPAPLIDAVRAKGYEVFSRADADGWKVWVRA